MWNVNTNTLLTHNDYTKLHELCLAVIEYNINVLGFQGINLNLLNPRIRDDITVVCKHYFPIKIIQHYAYQIPYQLKPKGTMLVIIGHLSHSVCSTSSDAMGRWCRATLELANHK